MFCTLNWIDNCWWISLSLSNLLLCHFMLIISCCTAQISSLTKSHWLVYFLSKSNRSLIWLGQNIFLVSFSLTVESKIDKMTEKDDRIWPGNMNQMYCQKVNSFHYLVKLLRFLVFFIRSLARSYSVILKVKFGHLFGHLD